MIHWTLALACGECGAKITYEDERPDWQIDDKRQRLIAEADAFVEEHTVLKVVGGTIFSPQFDVTLPAYIDRDIFGNLSIYRPAVQYIQCPACDNRVYIDQHALIDTPGTLEEAAT